MHLANTFNFGSGELITEKISLQAAMRRNQAEFVWSAAQDHDVCSQWGTQAYSGEMLATAAIEEVTTAFINGSQWQIGAGLYRRDLCIKVGLFRALSALRVGISRQNVGNLPSNAFIAGDYAIWHSKTTNNCGSMAR